MNIPGYISTVVGHYPVKCSVYSSDNSKHLMHLKTVQSCSSNVG